MQHSVGIWHMLAQVPINPGRFGEPNGIVGVSSHDATLKTGTFELQTDKNGFRSTPKYDVVLYMSAQNSGVVF